MLTTPSCIYVSDQPVNGRWATLCPDVWHVEHWMTTNMLKLNNEKTDILLIGSATRLRKVKLDTILIGNTPVPIHSEPVDNLGAMFDGNLLMAAQISSIAKSKHTENEIMRNT